VTARSTVDEDELVVMTWAQEEFGELPKEVNLWDIDDNRIECLIRLEDAVVITALVGDGSEWIDEQRLTIGAEDWTPGSIQANRRPSGCIRVRYRRHHIEIAAEIKSPHSVASTLEGWLLAMRDEQHTPRDRNRRIANLKRQSESIRRMLEQGSLDRIGQEVELAKSKISFTEIEIGGRAPAAVIDDED
tara:strand:+ start:2499 stop:3065 length:567 start_codon:yes stop_codon:yes gene_type:complete